MGRLDECDPMTSTVCPALEITRFIKYLRNADSQVRIIDCVEDRNKAFGEIECFEGALQTYGEVVADTFRVDPREERIQSRLEYIKTMEKIGEKKIWSYYDDCEKVQSVKKTSEIRGGKGHKVTSYIELAKKIAELQYLNRDHLLMFRGQAKDHKTSKNNTMMKASIFRNEDGKLPNDEILGKRFKLLRAAGASLQSHYQKNNLRFRQNISRYRIIRWAILQHYGICETPLLDVTHSLRIAASFAADRNESEEAFVFALGVPNLSGAVTASSEAGLQIVRLSSACPPTAVRPHIQEGYLLGDYPEISDTGQKSLYDVYEMDFGRRLVAKFRFRPGNFLRDSNHPLLGRDALYPKKSEDDFLDTLSSVVDEMEM